MGGNGRCYYCLGSGLLADLAVRMFRQAFPGAEVYEDDVLDEVNVYEPTLAADEYASLGMQVAVRFYSIE